MKVRFEKELALIQHQSIREVVEFALDHAPARFWTDPATSKGKYHSPDEAGTGGLVLHTKRVVGAYRVLAPAYSLLEGSLEWDKGLAACILHDIVKYGTGQGPSFDFAAYRRHGPNVGMWYQDQKGVAFEDLSDTETEIFELTSTHMGPWSPEGKGPESPIQWAVFMSDFVASRKQWSHAMEVL